NNNHPLIFGEPNQLALGPYATLIDPDGNPTSKPTIRDQEGGQSGDSINFIVAGGGSTSSHTNGRGMFEDMDGDNLPDYLPIATGGLVGMKQIPFMQSGVSQASMGIYNFPGLSAPYTHETNVVV